MHVVATAGHVDHGKSTLVEALTGMDPDRFAEEKARGLTIDLGFAWTVLPSGRELAFVDVPGHVRFLKNMLAGVGAVDACVFVVAATEGWKPQSEEHLRILELVGVRHGVVALTKVAGVDADGEELARLDVADRVAGTFLDGATVVAVDVPAGRGVGDLREAIDRMLATAPTSADLGRPRLWVDRSFAAKGSGTVVTGTLAGGTIALDDELDLLPLARRVRVRGLQTHGSPISAAPPGRRLALNVAGVAHADIDRGDALVRTDQWAPTRTLDATLRVLAGVGHMVSRRGAYLAYIGSGEHSVGLRVLGPAEIAPGEEGHVRLHLGVRLPLLPGDRYVLREAGRAETVGGGEVLDVAPVLPAAKARPDRSVQRVVAERGWIDAGALERMTGARVPPTVGRWVVAPDVRRDAEGRLLDAVLAAGDLGLDLATLDERDRALVAGLDGVHIEGGRARDRSTVGSGAGGQVPAYVVALEASPFAPPTPEEAGVARAAVRDLVRQGLVVERDGFHFAPSAVEEAIRRVGEALDASPEGVTVSRLRDVLGTSRKFLLPLLNHLDAAGVTRRRGDVRVRGPRLGPTAAGGSGGDPV